MCMFTSGMGMQSFEGQARSLARYILWDGVDWMITASLGDIIVSKCSIIGYEVSSFVPSYRIQGFVFIAIYAYFRPCVQLRLTKAIIE